MEKRKRGTTTATPPVDPVDAAGADVKRAAELLVNSAANDATGSTAEAMAAAVGDAPKRRGRPRGSKAATDPVREQEAKDLGGAIQATGNVLIGMAGTEPTITDEQALSLGRAWQRVIEAYAGKEVSPLWAAIGATALVATPHAIQLAMRAANKRQAARVALAEAREADRVIRRME